MKRRNKMKRVICLCAVVLVITSVAFAAQKITVKDLAALKGTWEGRVEFGVMSASTATAKLEILNDTAPVKAKLTLSGVDQQTATALGITGPGVFENNEGVITTQGTLMWAANQNFLEVSHTKDKKLDGTYYLRGVKGSMSLTKK
jgi:hypothetical protein